MNICKSLCFSVSFVLVFAAATAFSQQRPRIIPNQPVGTSQTTTQISNPTLQRPILTNQLIVQNSAPLVKKTVSSQPIGNVPIAFKVASNYSASFSTNLLRAIQIRIGIPYRYGSSGPTSFDCSGLVWSVFSDAGFDYERSSARTLWQSSTPVEGDDRYRFGTLVFFNKLGHIGIVYDQSGFYHASSSQGVTFSKFDGYWAKRIVGFRRLHTGE